MLKTNLVLGSVASLALAIAASPAFAQSPPQYPDHSLPWEFAQTQQLNAQQAAEPGVTITTPAATAAIVTPDTTAVVASTDNSSDVVAYDQALAANNQTLQSQQSQFANDQANYQSQLSDFQAKQSAYEQSLQDYHNRMAQVSSSQAVPMSGAVIAQSSVVGQPVAFGQETCTRPVVHQETFTRPVVRQETITRPVVRQETITRPVVEQQTITRNVVTQETYTRPVQMF